MTNNFGLNPKSSLKLESLLKHIKIGFLAECLVNNISYLSDINVL